ncbi:MAG: hypothetical protein ACFFAS_06865 [Promethearchaeota archaeon]
MDCGQNGLLSIRINRGVVCDHEFIVYVDNDCNIRNCFELDFSAGMELDSPLEQVESLGRINFDINAIKLNIEPIQLVYCMRAIMFGKNVALVHNKEFLHEQIASFIRYIFSQSFKCNVITLTESEFENNSLGYQERVIINGAKIICINDLLDMHKRLKIEKQVFQEFYKMKNDYLSLTLLVNEINKIHSISRYIYMASQGRGRKNLIHKEIKKNLFKLIPNLSNKYYRLAFDVARRYFKAPDLIN